LGGASLEAEATDASCERGVMKWVKRACWAAAWGAWAWCGVGLHRELPRDWAPGLRRLPQEFVGFVQDAEIVVCRGANDGKEFQSFDARTGARIHDRARIAVDGKTGIVSLRHGVGVGVHFDAWLKEPRADALQAFDFRTGEWRELGAKQQRIFDVHRQKPWIAVRLENGEANRPRVGVFDVHAGKTLGIWESARPPEHSVDFVNDCYFDGDDELVFFIVRNVPAERGATGVVQRFEHWSAAQGSVGKAVPLERVYYRSTKPAGGRIAMMGFAGRPDAIEVLDHHSGASLISSDVVDLDAGGQRRTFPLEPVLSPSGRALMGRSNCLWSVDERRPIWKGSQSAEEVLFANAGAARFGVREDWAQALGRLGVRSNRWTFAVRDYDTGAVCYRVWGTGPASNDFDPGVRYALLRREAEETGAEEPEYVIVDSAPNVNWTFIAICQLVLALPVVSVWAVLRRRRFSEVEETVTRG